MYSYSFYRCSSLGLFGLVIDHVQDIQDHVKYGRNDFERTSEHRAEHSEILQDIGVYSTNCTSNIVRLFAKLVYWHRFHTRAPRVSPVTSFKLSSIELSCVGFDSA